MIGRPHRYAIGIAVTLAMTAHGQLNVVPAVQSWTPPDGANSAESNGLAADKTSAQNSASATQWPAKIIPAPAEMELHPGFFLVGANTVIVAQTAGELRVAHILADRLSRTANWSPTIARQGAGISLRIGDIPTGAEGYTLTAKSDGIEIVGKTAQGPRLGGGIPASTFAAGRAWRPTDQKCQLEKCPPFLSKTNPRFPWRGLMLDVSRKISEHGHDSKTA